ncbi:MAG TPA: hypothetical protein VGO04_02065 [Ensifer sp.]|jgi:hypothetical protein|uniref:hypothetical protein n=1 Tax=Ensifer sp. TaxID=1872086 RepID=UPI002E1341F3|nr:hypothetical protein [Ensifer sp.]
MIGHNASPGGSIAAATISTAAIAASASVETDETAVLAIAGAIASLAPSAPNLVRNTGDDEARDADQYEAGEQLGHSLAPSTVDTLKGNQQ